MTLPILALGVLGGTASMQQTLKHAGGIPCIDVQGLLDSLPQLHDLARVRAQTLYLLPSAALDFESCLKVLAWARRQVDEGATGVVLSQGTDTLEECAYFLDTLWDRDEPLIVTGAMRLAGHISADGPANLLSAARVALDSRSRARGVQVVMNDEIHTAQRVHKADSQALEAFTSPRFGPVGYVLEARVMYHAAPSRRAPLPYPHKTDHHVALLEASLGADTLLLDQVLALGYRGLVIGAYGAGHVCERWADAIGAIAKHVPVMIASSCESGSTAIATYGFAGGEIDLQARGAVMGGHLTPRKSRILLWLLLGCGQQGELHQRVAAIDRTIAS